MMKKENRIVIAGIGMLPVREYWAEGLRALGARAVRQALSDAGGLVPEAIYTGNAFASLLSQQANLGALISESAGFTGVESFTFEAGGASGAAAFRAACMAVESGMVDVAVALGVEKVTETTDSIAQDAQNLLLNYEFEGMNGMTLPSQSALIARRYLHAYQLERDIFRPFPLNAYANAQKSEIAIHRNGLSEKKWRNQPMRFDPLGLFDCAMLADGAAALVVTRETLVPQEEQDHMVDVIGSASATAPLSLHDRPNPLTYDAAFYAAQRAFRQARLASPNEITLWELWDASVIDLILSIEATGLSSAGEGWKRTDLRLSSHGGCLGRGNPLGASGAYQLAEAVTWLRNEGKSGSKAFALALGGCGATAISHILEKR